MRKYLYLSLTTAVWLFGLTACQPAENDTSERSDSVDATTAGQVVISDSVPISCGEYLGSVVRPTASRATLMRAFGRPDSARVFGYPHVKGVKDPSQALDTLITLDYYHPSASFELEKSAAGEETLTQAMIWDNDFLPAEAKTIGESIEAVQARLGRDSPGSADLPPLSEAPRFLFVCAESGTLTFWTDDGKVGVIEYSPR